MLWGGVPKPDDAPEASAPRALQSGPPVLDPLAEEVLHDKVLLWRCEQLLQMGFTLQQARVVAVARTVDLHAVRSLISRGCEPHVAFDIVS